MNNKCLNICNNCGKQGHIFHQCKLPITSYGIIVYRESKKDIQYLMIRRKDTFGYIDFIRGKYNPYNLEQLQNIFDEMCILEKERIQSLDFSTLWKTMWGDTTINLQYKNEETSSQKKFEQLKEGIYIDDMFINLTYLIENSKTVWDEPEWEFPKGRRNTNEKDIDCALREFEEETGYSKKDLTIVENLLPFDEIFIGSNHKSYKHRYFLAHMNNQMDLYENFQLTEVSKIEWKTYEQCIDSIRPYNLEKKNVIKNINKILEEYHLY
jgi:8-oxo-dGTP pyrophosphatase MutT (NUDIX family)